FLPTELLHPREAMTLINNAGGFAVWAHPHGERFDEILKLLIDWGVRGLECIRPRLSPTEVQFFEETAKHHGLLVSGGSDWHGTWHGKLGDFHVRNDEVAAFLDAGGL
ncbi:MAG TPA: hypothetical protein VM100_10340, partial [Longimicrobiales bacterium]|nr:hypothetical protein [Longimicrobiales bacterium]